MDKSIKILHLSDVHIGNPKNKHDEETVFDPLFEDLKKANETPDVIIFSGDLAYGELEDSTIKDQYKKSLIFLENIYKCFNKTFKEIPILIIPGNHDVNRSRLDEPQKQYRESYNEQLIEDMMHKDQDLTWDNIIQRQKEWNEFIKEIRNRSSNFFKSMPSVIS